MKKAKLTRGKLKVYLIKIYNSVIAEKVIKHFADAFSKGPITFDLFCDYFNTLINFKFGDEHHEKLLKMGFAVYDFNDDKSICELDIVSFLKSSENDE